MSLEEVEQSLKELLTVGWSREARTTIPSRSSGQWRSRRWQSHASSSRVLPYFTQKESQFLNTAIPQVERSKKSNVRLSR